MQQADDFIDTTDSDALELVQAGSAGTAGHPPLTDPATKVVVALANEMQKAYANDQQKLSAANSRLRRAIRK